MWFMPAGDTGGCLGKGGLDPDRPQRWQEKQLHLVLSWSWKELSLVWLVRRELVAECQWVL